jgi:uncharacterized protein YndB with AHSA1/START domain
MTEELRLQRLIDAPREEVFRAFTTHAGQVAFYDTDEPGWIVESHCDLRPGGAWTVTFGPSSDYLYEHHSVFELVDSPHRIVLTTTEHHPDRPSFTFRVEYRFEQQDGRTLMTIIQSGFPTRELRDEHGIGVPNAVDQLERALRRGQEQPGGRPPAPK